MVRKWFFICLFVLIAAIILTNIDLHALAAPLGQESNPPERIRPDQYSYHGQEEIPFLNSSAQPPPQTDSTSLPAVNSSMITFARYSESDFEIYRGYGDWSGYGSLTDNEAFDIQPRLNHGANKIVFASDRVAGVYEIYAMGIDGDYETRLTENQTDDVRPVWSPNGTRIAFQAYRDGNSEIYVMNDDGSGQTNLSQNPSYDGEPFWSPDGSRIAFCSYRTGGYRIWVMNADGSNPIMLSNQRYSENPVWSPDGSRIGYDADDDDDGWQELWSMNANGSSQVLRSTPYNNYTYLANGWSPDANWFTFTSLHLVYYYGDWYWDYAFLKKLSSNGDIETISSFGSDWDLDWTTMDGLPPTTSMTQLSPTAPYQFVVSWSGQDDLSGVLNYDVQVREGASGTWTNWQMATSAPSAIYTGVGGQDYFFRSRARDKAFNTGVWPASYQAHATVETAPPISQVNPVEVATRGVVVTLTWGGHDVSGSGIMDYDLQFMDGLGGAWVDWLVDTLLTSADFTGELGHTYYFRSRAMDNALNQEDWPGGEGDTHTSFYSWRSIGTVSDNTGVRISAATVDVTPPAFLSIPSDVAGYYSAYMADNPPLKTITWSKDGYGVLPATAYGVADAYVDAVLPPIDNVVEDWGFESGLLPGVWQVGGSLSPALDQTYRHNGTYAASMGATAGLGSPELITQALYFYDVSDPFAFDALGGAHMAWSSWDNGYKVYYSHRPAGEAWSEAELVTEPQNPVRIGTLAVDADLNVHLVYDGENGGIYYAMRDAGGAWSTPQLVVPNGWTRDFVIDRFSNIHFLSTGYYGLDYVHLTPGGEWQVEQVPGVPGYSLASLDVASDGRVHVVWSDSFSLGLQVFYMVRQPGGVWSSPEVVSDTSYLYGVDILLDSTDVPHVAWTDGADNPSLYYSHKLADGSWSQAQNISGTSYVPSFKSLIDSQDNLYYFWTDPGDSGSTGAYVVQVFKNGLWTDPLMISETGNPPSDIDADLSGGDVFVTWAEAWESYSDIFFNRLHAGVWGSPVLLSVTSEFSSLPHVAADSMGGCNIVWYDTDSAENHSLYRLSSLPLEQGGELWLSQSITVPLTMTNPVLSFLASLSGVSTISGDEFSLLVSTETTTSTLYTSTTPAPWSHIWLDMAPWAGETVTLTFRLTETEAYPPAHVLLDEVTLGEAYPDTWVKLSGGEPVISPGDQLTYLVDYGNHGGAVAASSVITLTLPLGIEYVNGSLPPSIIGDQLIWQLGDLPSGSDFDPLWVILEASAEAPASQVLVTTVEIRSASLELELLNNSDQATTYITYRSYLSLIAR